MYLSSFRSSSSSGLVFLISTGPNHTAWLGKVSSKPKERWVPQLCWLKNPQNLHWFQFLASKSIHFARFCQFAAKWMPVRHNAEYARIHKPKGYRLFHWHRLQAYPQSFWFLLRQLLHYFDAYRDPWHHLKKSQISNKLPINFWSRLHRQATHRALTFLF